MEKFLVDIKYMTSGEGLDGLDNYLWEVGSTILEFRMNGGRRIQEKSWGLCKY